MTKLGIIAQGRPAQLFPLVYFLHSLLTIQPFCSQPPELPSPQPRPKHIMPSRGTKRDQGHGGYHPSWSRVTSPVGNLSHGRSERVSAYCPTLSGFCVCVCARGRPYQNTHYWTISARHHSFLSIGSDDGEPIPAQQNPVDRPVGRGAKFNNHKRCVLP